METARTVLPAVGLLLGVAIGWMWGMSAVPEPSEKPAPTPTCSPSTAAAEVRGLELELALLRAEQEEGW